MSGTTAFFSSASKFLDQVLTKSIDEKLVRCARTILTRLVTKTNKLKQYLQNDEKTLVYVLQVIRNYEHQVICTKISDPQVLNCLCTLTNDTVHTTSEMKHLC